MSIHHLSVIVPTWRDTLAVRLTAQRLLPQLQPGDELLIVDNGSLEQHDEVRAELPLHPSLTVLHCAIRGSYAARNRGAAAATGDVLAFTDAGCVPNARWLAAVRQHFEQPRAARVTGPILMTYGGRRPTLFALVDEAMHLHQNRYVGEGWAATANLAMRRSAFEASGGFDPCLLSGGDHEFGVRCMAAGIDIAWQPEMSVEHEARATLAELLIKRRRIIEGVHQLALRPAYAEALARVQRHAALLDKPARREPPCIGLWDRLAMKVARRVVRIHDRRYRRQLARTIRPDRPGPSALHLID